MTKENKTRNVRAIVAAVVFVVLALGLILGVSFGTLSGFGWDTFSALCPLGALTTMIATKTMVPRAVVSLAVMALLVLLVGRAFCGWLCPVTLLGHIRRFFRSPKKKRELEQAKREELIAIARQELGEGERVVSGTSAGADGAASGAGADAAAVVGELSANERVSLAKAAGGHACAACGACQPQKHGKLDTRHVVLGGALASTAIFGFPVFCLVCPVGLTFATVLVVWRLFSAGETTLSVILIPLLLVVELVFLRKWCTRFCPLAGLMNLASRFSRTWVPAIDDSKCLETSTGHACSRCAMACEADINIRHPEFGERTMADCTRCRACVDACPTGAISMPFVVKKDKSGAAVVELAAAEGEEARL